MLLQRPEPLIRNFTANLMAYALGRRMEYYDQPEIREIARNADANGNRMSSFIKGVIESEAFQMTKPVAVEGCAQRQLSLKSFARDLAEESQRFRPQRRNYSAPNERNYSAPSDAFRSRMTTPSILPSTSNAGSVRGNPYCAHPKAERDLPQGIDDLVDGRTVGCRVLVGADLPGVDHVEVQVHIDVFDLLPEPA